jgi:hypothetical protein
MSSNRLVWIETRNLRVLDCQGGQLTPSPLLFGTFGSDGKLAGANSIRTSPVLTSNLINLTPPTTLTVFGSSLLQAAASNIVHMTNTSAPANRFCLAHRQTRSGFWKRTYQRGSRCALHFSTFLDSGFVFGPPPLHPHREGVVMCFVFVLSLRFLFKSQIYKHELGIIYR